MNRIEIVYKAAREWDGREMTIVQEPATDEAVEHYRWVRDQADQEACHATKVGFFGASYNGQAPRDWLLDRDQIEAIRVDADADRVRAEPERPDLWAGHSDQLEDLEGDAAAM